MPFIKMLVACLFIYSLKVDDFNQHRCLIIDGIGQKLQRHKRDLYP